MEASMRSRGFWMHSSQRFSRDPACELPRLPAADAADEAAGPVGLPRGPERQDQTENEGSSWNLEGDDKSRSEAGSKWLR